jgi:uncharacterized protein (TIGR03083 family)
VDPLACLTADGAAITAATAADPDGPVPTCPGWTMTDLADHVSGVFAFATASLLAADGVRPPRPTDVEPVTDALEVLLATLAAVDPAAMRPTLLGPRPAAWWRRRLHHEMAVHRLDAMPDADPSAWISPDCALDGIDEYVTDLAPVLGSDAGVDPVDGEPVDRFLRLWGR